MVGDSPARLGVPATPFFYTVDQVAGLLQIKEESVRTSILFYTGRSTGVPHKDQLIATNMMPEGQTPEWRILDKHLYRFLRFKGYRFQQVGYN